MSKIDVHQHLWSEPLVAALSRRRELPFVSEEAGLHVLFLAGERPYVLELAGERRAARELLLDRDGLDGALLCPSLPLGAEWLARAESLALIDAYLDGTLSLGERFGAWGAVPLRRPDRADVDRALAAGCTGIALPAGALGGAAELELLEPVLSRLEELGAPLFVHPGPGPGAAAACSLRDPLWWPALTAYVAQVQSAWLAFAAGGRRSHPELRVVFAMLAGLAPLQAERLLARGAGTAVLEDPLIFYETSSYGPRMHAAVAALVGAEQVLYGSDRPVVEPAELDMPAAVDWEPVGRAGERAFADAPVPGSARRPPEHAAAGVAR
jgi:hypothetical protein